MSRIVLGVAGGIAAYKACELLRRLTETGHVVRVLPTVSALQFVGAATFEALSGQPVHTGVFIDVPAVPHVKLGQEADLVVVAPATADLLSRAAHVDQTDFPQDPQVFGGLRLRDAESDGDVVHRPLPLGEQVEDLAPQRFRDRVEGVRGGCRACHARIICR